MDASRVWRAAGWSSASLCFAGLLSCATASGSRSAAEGAASPPRLPAAGVQFDRALGELADARFGAAEEALASVRERCGDAPLGRQALLLTAALELDPRNPDRRLDLGTELAGRYLQLPEQEGWIRPTASSLYLLGRELGGGIELHTDSLQRLRTRLEDVTGSPAPGAGSCEAHGSTTRGLNALPRLDVAPVPERVRSALASKDSALDSMSAVQDSLRSQIDSLQREIRRIRETLSP